MPEELVETSEKETGRLEAFSDGVFAVAITLLALELKVPKLEENVNSQTLANALLNQWPGYFAFTTSFITVLLMWVHHHQILKHVRRADPPLMYANGLLLLLITAVPFSTAVITEYWRTPAAPAATTFYAGTFVLIAIAFYIFLMTAIRPALLAPGAAQTRIVQRFRRDYKWGPPLYLAAALAAPLSPLLAMAICTALWIFWAVSTKEC